MMTNHKRHRVRRGWSIPKVAILVAAGMSAAVLAGCADGDGHASLSRGPIDCQQDIAGQVAEFRQALQEKPNSHSRQKRLAEAEAGAADCHLARARAYQADRQPHQALEELERALSYMPTHPESLRLRDELTTQVAQSEQWAWDASAAAEQEQWREAYELAGRALAIDGTCQAALQVQSKAREVLVPRALTEAREAIDAGRLADAEAALADVEALDPGNAQARALRQDLAERARAIAATPPPPPPTVAPEDAAPQAIPDRQQTAAPEPELIRIHEGWLSREDDRYPKAWPMVQEHVTIELDDTDDEPLTADIEIKIGSEDEIEMEEQRVGGMFWFEALSGRRYRFVLLEIIDSTETIRFAIDTTR